MNELSGKSIAISVSDAPDRQRLGLPAREVDRALFSICTVLVRRGANVVFSGNLDPAGLTFKMFRHLAGTYATASRIPFIHIVPEPVLRTAAYDELLTTLRAGAAVVETFVHIDGELLRLRAVEDGLRIGQGRPRIRLTDSTQLSQWLSTKKTLDQASALSAARRSATSRSDARIVLGGKMGVIGIPDDKFLGEMPGIVEETVLALESGQPVIPLGAFGGATRDVAIALDLLDPSKRVPRGEQPTAYAASLAKVATLRGAIPVQMRSILETLADDDRGEAMAYGVAEALDNWLRQENQRP